MPGGLWFVKCGGFLLLVFLLLQWGAFGKSHNHQKHRFIAAGLGSLSEEDPASENEGGRRKGSYGVTPCQKLNRRERSLSMTAVYQCRARGLFSLEDECRIFLNCARAGEIALIDCCPAGLHFDNDRGGCVPMEIAECTDLDAAMIVADYVYELDPPDNQPEGYYEDDDYLNGKAAQVVPPSNQAVPWVYYPAPDNLFPGAFWSRDPHNGHMWPAKYGYAVPMSISYKTKPVNIVKEPLETPPPPVASRTGVSLLPVSTNGSLTNTSTVAKPATSPGTPPSSSQNGKKPTTSPGLSSSQLQNGANATTSSGSSSSPQQNLTKPTASPASSPSSSQNLSKSTESPSAPQKITIPLLTPGKGKVDNSGAFEQTDQDSDEQAPGSKPTTKPPTKPPVANQTPGFNLTTKDSDEQAGVTFPSGTLIPTTINPISGNDFNKDSHEGLSSRTDTYLNVTDSEKNTNNNVRDVTGNTTIVHKCQNCIFSKVMKKPSKKKGVRKRSKLESVAIINPKPTDEQDEGQKRRGSKSNATENQRWFPRFDEDSEEHGDPIQMGIIPLPEVGSGSRGILRKRAVNNLVRKRVGKKRKSKRAHHRPSVKRR